MFKEFTRVDGRDKVLGRAIYAEDVQQPNMVYGAMVRSPHAHARIKNIDTKRAMEMDKVIGVLTAKDIPGSAGKDKERPVLVPEIVRFVGDGVAMVVAETQTAAREAARRVEVDYELLPAVFDSVEAMKDDAPSVHGESNLEKTIQLRKGNVERAFLQADVILEKSMSTHRVQHMSLEPECATAIPRTDGVTVHCSGKSIFAVRQMIAETLGFEVENVRVISPVIGGGFGSRDYDMCVLGSRVALAATVFDRPCRLVYTREGAVSEGVKRHPYRLNYKFGAKENGRITAMKIDIVSDAGAYLSKSAIIGWRSVVDASGPYYVPNVLTNLDVVYTNNVYSDALRGFGSPQVDFACEVMMSEMAVRLGLDPLEIRRINMLRNGDLSASGQTMTGVSIRKCLDELEENLDYQNTLAEVAAFNANKQNKGKARGVGLSALMRGESMGGGAPDAAGVDVHIDLNGSVSISSSYSEVGQGGHSMLARIVSEVLGIEPSRINVSRCDTNVVPDSGPTGASRGSVMIGNAALSAAKEVRKKLSETVSGLWEVEPAQIRFHDEKLSFPSNPILEMSFEEAVSRTYAQNSNVCGQGWWTAPKTKWDWDKGQGEAFFAYVFGANGAVVEVDLDTGKTEVIKYVAVHDVGKAMNMEEVKGQIIGGVTMGIGYCTMEELHMKDGSIKNDNYDNYIIPTAMDIQEIIPVVLEEYSDVGPLGAKGVGEAVTSIVAPSITNAISHAIGHRIYDLPANLERVLALVKETD
jgi:CO/xanthine dehydrogenase Mo-binding subunit